MDLKELNAIVENGEDGKHQFKSDVKNADSLGSEMAAFANDKGGMILIGVADNGEVHGLSKEDVRRINGLISNSASQHVRSPLSVDSENIAVGEGRVVIVVTIPKGIDKPYFDKNGVIWLKCGSDKRRVNSKEELRRLFQMSDQFHADELPTKAGINALDRIRFRDFLRDKYKKPLPESDSDLLRLLQNMNLATESGRLNLAGLLLFAEQPERYKPQFVIKAACFPGNKIHATDYKDMEDFEGPLQKIFNDSLAFIMRNLHKVQAGRGVNAPGTPEIPQAVFEELLVNALVHRDYLVSAPIRLFIFDNRIEIISPGHLPNNLTVEKILSGNSNSRNPIINSFVAKGLLPYRGLGSGIERALDEWSKISFVDDREGCLFKCEIQRLKSQNDTIKGDKEPFKVSQQTVKGSFSAFKGSKFESLSDTEKKILLAIDESPAITYSALAEVCGKSRETIARSMKTLTEKSLIKRVGSKKTGYWEIIDDLRLED